MYKQKHKQNARCNIKNNTNFSFKPGDEDLNLLHQVIFKYDLNYPIKYFTYQFNINLIIKKNQLSIIYIYRHSFFL